MALIRLAWFGASRLIPLLESPMVASSNASSCLAWLVMVALVVLAAFSDGQDVLCRSAVGVVEVLQRPASRRVSSRCAD